jgi:hypothetical protein
MTQLSLRTSFALCLPLVAACNYGADIAKESGGTEAPPPADAGAPESATEGDDAASTSDDSGPTTGIGGVSFVLMAGAKTPVSNVIGEFVAKVEPGTVTPPCTYRSDGPCSIALCPLGATSSSTTTLVSAGPMTVSGYSAPIMPGKDYLPGAYYVSDNTALWTAGETISVSATGAAVPAFKGSVEFPSTLVVTTPAITTISKSAGLSLAWEPTTDTVLIDYSQGQTTGTNLSIQCTVAPPSSGFTLTASQISDLETGTTAVGNTVIGFDTSNQTLLRAGSYALTLSASTNAPTFFQPTDTTP